MGEFVNVVREGTKNYIGLLKNPFGKVLNIERKLSLHRFSFEDAYRSQIIFFDTNGNLLEKAGIILSKTIEPEKTFFKVERSSFLPRTFTRRKEVVFIHEVGVRDRIADHSFYLVDGIKSLFATQFTIDLENILKNCVPKIIISSNIRRFKVLSGGGFKAKIFFKDCKVKNFASKRVGKMKLLTVELNSAISYLNAFNYFNDAIVRYCKELIPFEETLFDYVHRITKPLPQKKKLTKEEIKKEKEKKKNTEDVIQG